MVWVGAVLIVVSLAAFVIGFVLFANATGVAPQRRTPEDPTGAKRAASGVEWSNLFRRIPSGFHVILDDDAHRSDKLAAVGSLFVLIAAIAAAAAILALSAALL